MEAIFLYVLVLSVMYIGPLPLGEKWSYDFTTVSVSVSSLALCQYVSR